MGLEFLEVLNIYVAVIDSPREGVNYATWDPVTRVVSVCKNMEARAQMEALADLFTDAEF